MSTDRPPAPYSNRSLLVVVPLAFVSAWIGLVIYQNRSDGGLSHFRKNVEELKAGKTKTLMLLWTKNADSLLDGIRGMPEIETVYMDGAHITVAGMRHLGSFPNLKVVEAYLGGHDPGLCDEGLLELRDCKKLELVLLYHAPISEEAIAKLKQQIPGVRVSTKHDEDRPAHDSEENHDSVVNPPDPNSDATPESN
jgi:hypothetical protein